MACDGAPPKASVEPATPAKSAVVEPTEPQGQGSGNPNRIYQLTDLKSITIKVGKTPIKLFVMDSPSKRQEGMMFLRPGEVKPNEGMIFVFPQEEPRSFWMRNTYLPLDLAYIAANGTIVSIKKMKPLDDSSVPSGGPAKYVLEMVSGSFGRLGIKQGMKLQLPALKAEDTPE